MNNIFELVDQKLKALREADEETQDQPKENSEGLINNCCFPL